MMKLVSAVVSKSTKAAALYNKVTGAKGEAVEGDVDALVLGQRTCGDGRVLVQTVASTVWLTYRRGFPAIHPASLSSDVGWGCMLRVGQMALAHVLVRVFLGAEWRLPVEFLHARVGGDSLGPPLPPLPDAYLDILRWFADVPDPAVPYSIHNIAWLGCRLGLNIGDWFAPTTIGNCLRYLVNAHAPASLAMYVAYDATVYLADLEAAATAPPGTPDPTDLTMWLVSPATASASHGVPDLPHVTPHANPTRLSATCASPPPPPAPTSAPPVFASASASSASASSASLPPRPASPPHPPPASSASASASASGASLPAVGACSADWRPLMLFVPVRLGLAELNPVYVDALKMLFTFPQTVGVLGGKPRGALFFVGVQGDSLVYLDPHSVQDVAFPTAADPASTFSYQCLSPRSLPILKIDPSMALCFFCPDLASLHDLLVRLDGLAVAFGVSLFSVIPGSSPSFDPDPNGDGGLTSWDDDDFEFV